MSSVNNINENVISDEAIKKVFTNNENWLNENIAKVPAAQNFVDASGKSFDKEVDNSIYKDQELLDNVKAFYYKRDGVSFDTDEGAIRKFISDRTWKQANTYSIGKELIYATSENVDLDQKRRLSYLTQYWSSLPNFYQEGGRGFSGLVDNIMKGVTDPLNVLSLGIAKATVGTAVGVAAKKGTQVALSKAAEKAAVRKAVGYATGAQFVTDGIFGASIDAAIQKTEKELLLRNKFDPKRMFTSAITTAGVGIIPGLVYSVPTAKAGVKEIGIRKSIDRITQETLDFAHPVKNLNHQLYGVKSNLEGYKTKGTEIDLLLKNFVSKNPDEPLAKKINNYFKQDNSDLNVGAGLKLNKKEIRLLTGINKDKINYLDYRDPGDYGYVQIRELAASTTRGKAAVDANGSVVLPVTADRTKLGIDTEIIVKGGFEKVNAKPLLKIYEPLEDAKLVGVFNNYVQARRSLILNKRGIATSMKKKEIKKSIDSYKKQNDKNKNILDTALQDLTLLSRAMIELNRRVGLISDIEAQKILDANPIYAPFYARTTESFRKVLREKDKIATPTETGKPRVVKGKEVPVAAGVKTPVKFEITGSDLDIKPLHESFAGYIFNTYQAAEKNLAKLRLYSEIDEAITKGHIAKGEIVETLKPIEFTKALRKDVVKALKDEADSRGVKFSKRLQSELLEGEDAIKVAAFKNNIKLKDGRILDLVYERGKLKKYIIKDTGYREMFQSLGGITGDYIGFMSKFIDGLVTGKGSVVGAGSKARAAGKIVGAVSRIFPNLITHSPPFIAFNGIRDTLSGSVNSAFGFNAASFAPGLDTAKGLFKTFKPGKEILAELSKTVRPKDPNFLKFMRGMKNAFSASRVYQKGLLSGGGFASRRDTELIVKSIRTQIKEQNIPAKDKNVYLKSFDFLKDIGYFGIDKTFDITRGYSALVNKIEYASRLGEFMLAKKAGMSDRVAGFAMREISTDFGMHGANAYLNAYNRSTMFFNAGLQGFYRGVLRRPTENPGKFATAVLGSIVVPEMVFWALTNETPEYQELSDDIKLLHYVIPVYMEDQPDGSHLRMTASGAYERKIKNFLLIPKPYDFGVFANIFRGIAEAVQEKNTDIAIQYFYASIAKVFPGLTKPTLLSPAIDLWLNKNYKNNEIVPYYKTRGNFQDRIISSSTRPSAIQLAAIINELYADFNPEKDPYDTKVSPIAIDYLINNYFVGLAQYLPDIYDAKFAWDEKAFGPRPSKRIDENDIANNIFSVITRRFVAKATPTKFSKNIGLIYEMRNQAQKITLDVETAENDLINIFRKQGIDMERGTREEAKNAFRAYPILQDAVIVLSSLKKQRDLIQFKKYDENGFELTAEKKRELIDKNLEEANKFAFNILRDIKSFKDPTFLVSRFGSKTYRDAADKTFTTKTIQKVFGDIQTKIFN